MDSSEKMNSIDPYMDPVLFKAAAEGHIRPVEKYQTRLDQLLTPDENTILHVYLRNQSREPESTDFVEIILEMCPPLLFQANKKGEIPLHLAARFGHSNVVRVLIDRAKARPTDPESGVTEAKKMLRMTNEEQDTALHEAARNNQSHVVEILTKEDPEFPYSANVHGETPLYITANSSWGTSMILTNCISVDYGGPNGRTALHAASRVGNPGTARKLLEKEEKLTKTTDENGWSPLHYAAYFKTISVVKVLLEYDASAAYVAETEKKRTALHLAAIRGRVGIMKEIVSRCPACCELVDNRGWNALHYAVASKDSKVFEQCLEILELARLGTKKDDKGNTPFHLIAALANKKVVWRRVSYKAGELCGLNKQKLNVDDIIFGKFGEIQKDILKSLEDVGRGPIGRGLFVLKGEEEKNNDEDNKEEFVLKVEEEKNNDEDNIDEFVLDNKEEEEALSKARESHLVVAALIATVTFAAAFTLPGGYKSDRGTAILAKKAAFIVFVISDTISMVLSILAVFIHFLISLIHGFELVKSENISEKAARKLFEFTMWLTMIGMSTMIIAFVTGTYAVLEPSLGLAIGTCLIGLSFFFLVLLVFRFILNDVAATKAHQF